MQIMPPAAIRSTCVGPGCQSPATDPNRSPLKILISMSQNGVNQTWMMTYSIPPGGNPDNLAISVNDDGNNTIDFLERKKRGALIFILRLIPRLA